MFNAISNSVTQTKQIGYKIAKYLNKESIIILSGDLGAGKTALVSGILSFFGKEDLVSSPTFTIINEYILNNNLKIFHFDLYRLNKEQEFSDIGGEEFFRKWYMYN